MTADFAEFHDELRSVARSALADRAPEHHGGNVAPPLSMAVLAEMGWSGLEVAEVHAGSGAGLAESVIIAAEHGRVVAASPFAATAVLAVGVLQQADAHHESARLQEVVAAGTGQVVVVSDAGAAIPRTDFVTTGGQRDRTLDGSCRFVLDAQQADVLIVPAHSQDGALELCVVDPSSPGVRIEALPLVDESRRAGRVQISGLEVPATAVIPVAGGAAALRAAYDRTAVAVAADSLAVAEAALDKTVTHVGDRHQFNRPLGSFQAVKHGCADSLIQISLATELLGLAIGHSTRPGSAAFGRAAAMVKAAAGEAAVAVTARAVQYHGAIGYSWETGLHAYQKRALLNRALFGSPAAHRATLSADRSAMPAVGGAAAP